MYAIFEVGTIPGLSQNISESIPGICGFQTDISDKWKLEKFTGDERMIPANNKSIKSRL